MAHRFPRFVPAVAASLVLGGCGQVVVGDLAPGALARTYFEALGRGDRAMAAACLAPDYSGPDKALDHYDAGRSADGVDHFSGMSGLTVTQPLGNGRYDGYPDTVELAATWKNAAGVTTRFVIMGRHSESDPYRVIAIGSGP